MSLALYLTELRAQTAVLVYCYSKQDLNIFRIIAANWSVTKIFGELGFTKPFLVPSNIHAQALFLVGFLIFLF